MQAEREQIRLELETSAIGLTEVRIRGMLIESYMLDCVVNFMRTGNYLGSGELRAKLTKQLQKQQIETQEGQE